MERGGKQLGRRSVCVKLQMLLRTCPNSTIKHRAPYWRVRGVEWVHGRLDVQLPEIMEKRFYSIVVLCLVQDDKLHISGGDKS